eukprot:2550194-Rhodomonas_salina.1
MWSTGWSRRGRSASGPQLSAPARCELCAAQSVPSLLRVVAVLGSSVVLLVITSHLGLDPHGGIEYKH